VIRLRCSPRPGRAGRPTRQLPLAERAHQQDAQAEFVGQRQDGPLGLALGWVVRHLHGAGPPGPHELGELAEGRRGVVGGADQAGQAPVPGRLEHRQVRGPGEEVADLHEAGPAAVPGHRAVQLGRALLSGRGPDLAGDEHLAALAVQRSGEQPPGVAVHRGGAGHRAAGRDRGADQLAVPARGRGGLEPPPGAQPHRRHADLAPAQVPVLHVCHLSPGPVSLDLMPINDPGGFVRAITGSRPDGLPGWDHR
jgi:hypothetical protein